MAAIRSAETGPAPAASSASVVESDEAKRFRQYVVDRYQHFDSRGMGVTDRVPLRLPLAELYVPLKARVELPEGDTWARELRVAGRAATEHEAEAMVRRVSDAQPVVDMLR